MEKANCGPWEPVLYSIRLEASLGLPALSWGPVLPLWPGFGLDLLALGLPRHSEAPPIRPFSLTLSCPQGTLPSVLWLPPLPLSKSQFRKFLGDMPSPVLSPEPQEGQLPRENPTDRAALTLMRVSLWKQVSVALACIPLGARETPSAVPGYCATLVNLDFLRR